MDRGFMRGCFWNMNPALTPGLCLSGKAAMGPSLYDSKSPFTVGAPSHRLHAAFGLGRMPVKFAEFVFIVTRHWAEAYV